MSIIQVPDIRKRISGTWHSLQGSKVYKNGTWHPFGRVRKGADWYEISPQTETLTQTILWQTGKESDGSYEQPWSDLILNAKWVTKKRPVVVFHTSAKSWC